MKCDQVQRLYDELAGGRLPAGLDREVRQHLTDCTDCRVQHQRTAKLQRLLALKRYERPAPVYFDTFLSHWHARLAAESNCGGFWRRLFAAADLEPLLSWRYGLATASCLVGALGLLWVGLSHPPADNPVASTAAISEPLIVPTPAVRVADHHLIAPRVELPLPRLAESEPVISTGQPALPGAPRYVLDRITVTHAAYEVTSSVDF